LPAPATRRRASRDGEPGERVDSAGASRAAARLLRQCHRQGRDGRTGFTIGVGKVMPIYSLRELEYEARRCLVPAVYAFFAGGADDEITLRENEAAFARIGLVPRVLRGAAPRELEVTLLGRRASMPILVAPTAFHRLAHPDGERATA